MKAVSLPALAVLILTTFATCPAHAELFSADRAEQSPSWFVTPEVFGFGRRSFLTSASQEPTYRVGGIDVQFWRLRVGTSLLELGYSTWSFQPIPVRLGFTIWQRPYRYVGCLYGMLPEVYIQTSSTLWPWRLDPPPYDSFVGHAELRAGADLYGVGLDVGAGVMAKYVSINFGSPYIYTWKFRPTVDARIKLGITNFGF